MPKLPSSQKIIKVLGKQGFVFISQKGSHLKYKNSGQLTVIIPADKKEIPIGTLKSIARQSHLTTEDFK